MSYKVNTTNNQNQEATNAYERMAVLAASECADDAVRLDACIELCKALKDDPDLLERLQKAVLSAVVIGGDGLPIRNFRPLVVLHELSTAPWCKATIQLRAMKAIVKYAGNKETE